MMRELHWVNPRIFFESQYIRFSPGVGMSLCVPKTTTCTYVHICNVDVILWRNNIHIVCICWCICTYVPTYICHAMKNVCPYRDITKDEYIICFRCLHTFMCAYSVCTLRLSFRIFPICVCEAFECTYIPVNVCTYEHVGAKLYGCLTRSQLFYTCPGTYMFGNP